MHIKYEFYSRIHHCRGGFLGWLFKIWSVRKFGGCLGWRICGYQGQVTWERNNFVWMQSDRFPREAARRMVIRSARIYYWQFAPAHWAFQILKPRGRIGRVFAAVSQKFFVDLC